MPEPAASKMPRTFALLIFSLERKNTSGSISERKFSCAHGMLQAVVSNSLWEFLRHASSCEPT
jgi:hypothetical protein